MGSELDRLRVALSGRYAVEREIGAGGMATVFLAADVKHGRKVAVKVLHRDVAAVVGSDRFLAEISLTASLQHPNILPLYDSGDADGMLYYVMPLVEGESLRDRMNREKHLPIDESIEIIRTVAAALDFAHERGVIHRDIKPENILLQHGQPLVADFGLALAVKAASGSRLTEAGISLGTPLYMSPEQALGEPHLDARADVYAMGATLYEMLAGRPPFNAATVQGIIAKLIAEPVPPISVDRPTVPSHVESAILVALEKLPADRFKSAGAFADALVNPSFNSQRFPSAQRTLPAGVARSGRLVALSLALAVASSALAAWLYLHRDTTHDGQTLRYRISLPPQQQQALTFRYASRVALSPDGSLLVFTGPSPQGVQLWMRKRDELEPTPIPGTEGGAAPFFSPDGRRVGFLNVGRLSLQAVELEGGTVTTLVPSGVRRVGASWGTDGIVYVDEKRGLMRLAPGASPASATVLLGLDKVSEPKWPQALPRGQGVIFTRSAGAGGKELEIDVLGEGSNEPRTVVRGIVALHARDGTLLFVNAAAELMAAPFDGRSGKLTGAPVRLDRNLEVQFDAVDITLSERGSLMYGSRSPGRENSEVVLTDREGTTRVLDVDWKGDFQAIDLSPDGRRLAVAQIDSGQKMDIWVKPVAGGAARKVTMDADRNFRSTWNPDNRTVGYIVEQGDVRQFHSRPADGSGTRKLELTTPVNQAVWSPDGKWLIYRTGRIDSLDIFARRLGPDSTIIPLAATPGVNEHSPSLSPDGRWLAFVSNRTGSWEVDVRPFPNAADGLWQVSTGGGTEPRWAHNSRELFYKSGGQMMVADIKPGAAFVIGQRRPLFPLDEYFNFAYQANYAVAPDDQHLYMIRSRKTGALFELVVVENWARTLRK